MSVPVYDWIAFNARRRPRKLAVRDLGTGREFDYGALHGRVGRAAAMLRARGVGKNDRVAALARNSSDLIELMFACKRIGAIYVPFNWRLAVPELRVVADDAGPSLVFANPEFADAAAALGRGRVLGLDPGVSTSDYEAALNATQPLPAAAPEREDGDPWMLLYTSGTTGKPKGAIVTYRTALWNLINHGVFSRITADSACLIFGPMFHVGALSAYAFPSLHAGATINLMRGFDAGAVNRHVGDPALAVTHINGATTMYQLMSRHETFADADFSRLVCATISGDAVPDALLRLYDEEKGLPLQNIYGLTEGGPVLTAMDAEGAVRKRGTVGTAVLHTELRLVDADGRDVADGEVGEIWARGPNVSPGYWNNPEATRAAFSDGWLRTGDAAWRDADGYYHLVDRWKDMYISGAENVYPAEVENAIYRMTGVAEVAVIGVPHERWGETGRAIVVRANGATFGEADVLAHCRAELARYKVPASVIFVEALPRSATGKVKKPDLRARFGQATGA